MKIQVHRGQQTIELDAKAAKAFAFQAGDRIEIWDATAWETYLSEQESSFADQAEEVVPGIF